MKNTFRLALRGLTRNRRRSLVTLLAIALGFAAIALFAGYTRNVFDGLQRQSIYGEMLGHLTLSKTGMRKEGKLDPERYLLTAPEVERITALLREEAHVDMVAPRLALSGLMSNGRASTIFIAEAIEPAAMARFQDNILSEDEIRSGMFNNQLKQLDPERIEVVELSEGLVDILHLAVGGQAAVLVNTLAGQANALDITVGHTFNTGNAGSNDKFAYMPLALARSLLDAEGRADRLTILLDDATQTLPMQAHLLKKLRDAGFDIEIKPATGSGFGLQTVVGGQHGSGPCQHALAGGGKAFKALATIDQLQPQLLLKAAQAHRQGRLGDMATRRRLAEVTRLVEGDEEFQLFDVHLRSRAYSNGGGILARLGLWSGWNPNL